jgi:hypothetical protein
MRQFGSYSFIRYVMAVKGAAVIHHPVGLGTAAQGASLRHPQLVPDPWL